MPDSDAATRVTERLEACVVAALLVVAVLGVTLWPLTTSAFVRTLVTAVHADDLTGIGHEATLSAAESVREFVVDADAPPLAARIAGRPAFDRAAVSHLTDVRNVLVPARELTLALLLVLGAWSLLRARSARGRALIGRTCALAAWALLAAATLAIATGALDFDGVFAWFHGLFFSAGTWMFPEDALLIQVFPLAFWTTAAACWGVLVLVAASAMLITRRRLCFTRRTHGV